MELKPIKYKREYERLIAKDIIKWFYDSFFKGCFEIVKNNQVENAQDVLRQAIINGAIFYQDGAFYSSNGRFSNAISKELENIGAKYSKWRKAYLISSKNLDIELLWAIQTTKAKTATVATAIQAYLASQLGKLTELQKNFVIDKTVEYIFEDLQRRTIKSLEEKNIPTIAPKFNDFRAQEFAKNYTENLDFWIKDWTEENIVKMREVVGQMAIDGKSRKDIADYIQNRFKVAKDKAQFLARNETAIATTSYLKAKYQDEGFTHFKWKTNLDGRERELHKELNGKIFAINDPPVIYINKKTGEQQRGLPGETYNCLTGDMKITSPFLHNRIFKRQFRGEVIELITDMGNLKLTPNHPILTNKGWVKASLLNIGDNIAKISNEAVSTCGSNPNYPETTIKEFFSFYAILFNQERIALTDNDFHGDVSIDKQVNTINIKAKLRDHIKPNINKSRIESILTKADEVFSFVDTSSDRTFLKAFPFSRFITDSFVGSLSKAFTFFFGSKSHSIEHTFRAVTWLNSLLFEITDYNITGNEKFLCELVDTKTINKKFFQRLLWELSYLMINNRIAELPNSFGQITSFNAEMLSNISNCQPAFIEFDTIKDKRVSKFSGHVYNLENSNNWYFTENYITKNCRCLMIPIYDKEFLQNRRKK